MATKISAQLQAKLKKARERFAKADPAESNTAANRKVPDGNYTAKLVGLEFDEFGKHPIMRFTFEVSDADKKAHEMAVGQIVETRFNLDTDEGPSFIKRDFGKFGYDNVNDLLDDLEASQQLFTELLALHPVVKIAVMMDDTDQWQNVYLNDVLEMDEAEAVEEEEEEEKPKPKPKAKGQKNAKEQPPADDETEDAESEEETDESDEGEEAEEETEKADESSDEAELEVGDIVEVNYKGKDTGAKVISIDEDNSSVKVELLKEKKRVIVPLEKVWLLEG